MFYWFFSLPKIHHNVKGNERGDGSNNHHKKFGKFKKDKHNEKNINNRAKGQRKCKGKTRPSCCSTSSMMGT
jgi:hypothetical protein